MLEAVNTETSDKKTNSLVHEKELNEFNRRKPNLVSTAERIHI